MQAPSGPTSPPGSTGTITIDSPYSQNGATAVIWGYYTANVVGSTEATFGSGTFSDGVATINYTVPANYKANSNSFYWNTDAYASGSSGAVSDYEDNSGAWGQFFTSNPNGQTVNQNVYTFDQFSVGLNSATFRASANGATAFPNQYAWGYCNVEVPWTGTLAQFMNSSGSNTYYTNGKWGVAPTALEDKGFLINVLQSSTGNPSGLNQFQEIQVYNPSTSYSVDLFAYKVASSADPLGYIYDATLVDAVDSGWAASNPATGVFNFTFDSPLDKNTMYFISPGLEEFYSPTGTTNSWVYGMNGTDLITSGVMVVPEPGTLSLLAAGGLAGLALVWRRRRAGK